MSTTFPSLYPLIGSGAHTFPFSISYVPLNMHGKQDPSTIQKRAENEFT